MIFSGTFSELDGVVLSDNEYCMVHSTHLPPGGAEVGDKWKNAAYFQAACS